MIVLKKSLERKFILTNVNKNVKMPKESWFSTDIHYVGK